MPSIIPLQRFTDHAAGLNDQAAIFARGHGTDRAPSADNGVRGLRRFFSSANTRANQHAVKAFWRSVKNDPACTAVRSEIKSLLRERLRSGAPLTAGIVKQVTGRMNEVAHFGQARELGSQLVASGALPAGHGTDFALHVTARNLPLGTDGEKKAALKSYLLDKMCQPNSPSFAKLTEISGQGNRGPLLSKALQKLCDPLSGPDGFFARQLDTMLEGGVESFSLDAFKASFQNANADKLDLLQHLGPDMLRMLGRPSSDSTGASNLLALLAEAQPTVGDGNLDKLAQFARGIPLNSPDARAACLRDFLWEDAVGGLGNSLAQRGLPSNLASALGHNPEVTRRIEARLSEEMAKPGAPQEGPELRDLIKTCVEETVSTFVTEHEADLREFVALSQHPPVAMKPPLSPDTLPRYLNALLSSNDLLTPLLDNDAVIDKSYVDKLQTFRDNVRSAAHSVRGEFGTDDADNIQSGVLALSLARRGVDESRYGEVMSRALARLSPMSCEMRTLAEVLNAQFFSNSTEGNLGDRASVYAAMTESGDVASLLNVMAKTLVDRMPQEQRVALGVVPPGTQAPAPDDDEARKTYQEQAHAFMNRHFNRPIPLEEFSSGMREWAAGLGLTRFPPARDGASGDRAENALQTANQKALALFTEQGAWNDLFPKEGGQSISPAFREAFDWAVQNAGVSDIDPDTLRSGDFLAEVREDLANEAIKAAGEGRTLDARSLEVVAQRSLIRQFGELQTLHTALDALPEPAPGYKPKAGEFTTTEKALMQEMAQTHGLRDVNALKALVVQARNGQAEMRHLASPDPSASLLADSFRVFTRSYLSAQTAIGEPKPRGNSGAPAVFCEMAMRLAGLSDPQAESVRENLSGPLAQTVAGAFLYPTGSPELPPDERNQLTTAVTLMNTTRTTAETQSRGNSELDPYFFSTVPEHPSEIPGGFYGCMKAVAHMAPTALSAEDKALSERVPPFSRADWDTLRPIASRVVKSDENQGFFTARWISAVGPELLAKQRAVGRDLSLGEIWSIVTGDRRMPQGVTEANFGTRLHDHAKGMAAGIVRALRPGMDEDRIPRDAEVMLGECAEKLIPPKQLRELARPDAVLNLSDIHMDLRMSDLTGYTPENAYGLVKDYIRQSSHTMRLDPGDGSGMDFSSIPIPQEENKPDNPIFQGIIANVRRLCDGNEAQTARVLQAFSQAPLVTTSSFMTPFTGGEHPHYPFTVTATRLDTGQVRVDIKSKDSAPLEYNVQYLIEPDGSHACTDFKMKRR